MSAPAWHAQADRISDAIVKVLNAEREKDPSPMGLLGGQLLALWALERTAPAAPFPPSLRALFEAVHACLEVMNDLRDE
jgi:hypothetical protein